MSEISFDILSELIVPALKTDKCSSVDVHIYPCYEYNSDESLVYARLFRAAHDLASLAWLATKPEEQDRFSGVHIFQCFFFLSCLTF